MHALLLLVFGSCGGDTNGLACLARTRVAQARLSQGTDMTPSTPTRASLRYPTSILYMSRRIRGEPLLLRGASHAASQRLVSVWFKLPGMTVRRGRQSRQVIIIFFPCQTVHENSFAVRGLSIGNNMSRSSGCGVLSDAWQNAWWSQRQAAAMPFSV